MIWYLNFYEVIFVDINPKRKWSNQTMIAEVIFISEFANYRIFWYCLFSLWYKISGCLPIHIDYSYIQISSNVNGKQHHKPVEFILYLLIAYCFILYILLFIHIYLLSIYLISIFIFILILLSLQQPFIYIQ